MANKYLSMISVSKAPMLLCRVSWLRHYDGRPGDPPFTNHSWVTGGGTPHESKNFLATPDGFLQGFVQVREWGKININRLGASRNDAALDGVTIVWCAQHPSEQGLVVVGWYVDATVFREGRKPRDGRTFDSGGETFARFEAQAANAVLLDVSARNFVIQPKGAPKGSVFGQSDLCYVDERLPDLARNLRTYIEGIQSAINETEQHNAFSGEPDSEHNAKVEKAAVEFVVGHYSEWTIKDRQKDNCGWDLEARKGGNLRRVEVKGRSPSAPAAVRLSPNEERSFVNASNDPAFATSYRLAVVHNALGRSPSLRLFRFTVEGKWICEITGEGLITQSAGIFASPIPNT
jgi:hypothetical protein